MKLVTVLGGYGVFGSRISAVLAELPDVRVRIAGRRRKPGEELARKIDGEFRECDATDRDSVRQAIDGSTLVVNTAGPFQGKDFRVAEQCIDCGSHYIDIADGREFVCGIAALHAAACERGLFVTSGASTVPAISDAMIRSVSAEFSTIDEIQIALSPGNKNPRGASTIAAILSYVGRPIRVWQEKQWTARPGWGDSRRLEFPPPVGFRRVYNCDGPDLELVPAAWRAATVRFRAGVELRVINVSLACIAWIRRRICAWESLPRRAPLFLKLSLLLGWLGTSNGSLAVSIHGTDPHGAAHERRVAIVTDTDGPAVPCAPAILLASRILADGPPCTGAFPCTGFIDLDAALKHLEPHRVWCVRGDRHGWKATCNRPAPPRTLDA